MAIDTLENTNLESIAKFYFVVLQYIHESHKVSLMQIQVDLHQIFNDLPTYLQDVSIVINQRLNILCDQSSTLEHIISNEVLKARYSKEASQNIIIHKGLQKLTFIHIDILDVIFA